MLAQGYPKLKTPEEVEQFLAAWRQQREVWGFAVIAQPSWELSNNITAALGPVPRVPGQSRKVLGALSVEQSSGLHCELLLSFLHLLSSIGPCLPGPVHEVLCSVASHLAFLQAAAAAACHTMCQCMCKGMRASYPAT